MKNLTFALRVLLKNKFYSLLNILGLAVGLAVAMIIFLYVQSDLGYDKYHQKYDQIVRVESKFNLNGKEDEYALASQFLAPYLKEDYPEIQNYTRYRTAGRVMIQSGDNQFNEEGLYYADSSTFNVFSYEMIEGDPQTALDDPNTMVMTETMARKYFGNNSPMDEILETANGNFKVTGIVKDLPDNLHLKFNGLLSYSTLEQNLSQLPPQARQGALWGVTDFVYLLLPKGYDSDLILQKFPDFYEKHMAPIARLANINGSFEPIFQSLADVHFESKGQFDLTGGNKNYPRAFTAIGIFILLLASINYMNLASARAAGRSKEVGIKKVMGSTKGSLVKQFLMESVVISFVSLLFAYGIVALIVHGIGVNDLMGKEIIFDLAGNSLLLFGSIGVTALIGLLSGFYPAFYLSSVSITRAIKGVVKSGPGSMMMRRVLVVFQFFISIGVIISTLLMKDQIDFMNTKDLGFNKDNVIMIPIQDTTVRNRIDFIKAELEQNPNVLGVTDALLATDGTGLGNSLLGATKSLLRVESADSTTIDDTFALMLIGDDYIETMQMEIIQGRNFDKNQPSDITQSVIVNEAMVRKMGWDDAIGKRVGFAVPGLPSPRVIGVVKDFNAFSLHSEVEPAVLLDKRINFGLGGQVPLTSFMVHAKGDNLRGTMSFLEQKFAEWDPSHPFEFSFLDSRSEALYRSDIRQSDLIGILSYICIFISCLGLLGLASFTTSQRIKEIGVRKVLGATVPQLVYMIFRDVLLLIVIGFVISIPVSYYLIDQWLQVFAYQMNLGQMLVLASVISGVLAILVAFLTVSYHSLKAANQNPIKALRYE